MTWIMNGKRWRIWYKSWPRETHPFPERAYWAWWYLYQNVYGNFAICICGISLQISQLEKAG
jgi:hypothetical protein